MSVWNKGYGAWWNSTWFTYRQVHWYMWSSYSACTGALNQLCVNSESSGRMHTYHSLFSTFKFTTTSKCKFLKWQSDDCCYLLRTNRMKMNRICPLSNPLCKIGKNSFRRFVAWIGTAPEAKQPSTKQVLTWLTMRSWRKWINSSKIEKTWWKRLIFMQRLVQQRKW